MDELQRKKVEGKQANRGEDKSGSENGTLDPSANPHWQGMSPAWQQLYGAIRRVVEE